MSSNLTDLCGVVMRVVADTGPDTVWVLGPDGLIEPEPISPDVLALFSLHRGAIGTKPSLLLVGCDTEGRYHVLGPVTSTPVPQVAP